MFRFSLFALLLGGMLWLSAATPLGEAPPPKFKFPSKINALVQDKCYGCHSAQGRGDKAKAALMWDDLGRLAPASLKEKMMAINKVAAEGAMPPAMFLERSPDKKLTDKEATMLQKWAGKYTK